MEPQEAVEVEPTSDEVVAHAQEQQEQATPCQSARLQQAAPLRRSRRNLARRRGG